jgi:hypothetical protein
MGSAHLWICDHVTCSIIKNVGGPALDFRQFVAVVKRNWIRIEQNSDVDMQ